MELDFRIFISLIVGFHQFSLIGYIDSECWNWFNDERNSEVLLLWLRCLKRIWHERIYAFICCFRGFFFFFLFGQCWWHSCRRNLGGTGIGLKCHGIASFFVGQRCWIWLEIEAEVFLAPPLSTQVSTCLQCFSPCAENRLFHTWCSWGFIIARNR